MRCGPPPSSPFLWRRRARGQRRAGNVAFLQELTRNIFGVNITGCAVAPLRHMAGHKRNGRRRHSPAGLQRCENQYKGENNYQIQLPHGSLAAVLFDRVALTGADKSCNPAAARRGADRHGNKRMIRDWDSISPEPLLSAVFLLKGPPASACVAQRRPPVPR